MEDVSQIRRDYKKNKLDEHSVPSEPFSFFDKWMGEALQGNFLEPTAFVLSTVSKENKPSSRVLLLKGYDNNGFVFYSNYTSQKGQDIESNNNVSMLFFWDQYERQIRIEGKVEKLTTEESNKYFQSRPYTSRIGAWASKQSQQLKSRFTLLRAAAKYMVKFKNDVPLPEFWGGYRVIPTSVEFWQGRESRLHDRVKYLKENNTWTIKRLYP